VADALLASGVVEKLQQRNVTLANELRTIETQRDMAALGTTAEREQWARVQRVEAALARGSRHTRVRELARSDWR